MNVEYFSPMGELIASPQLSALEDLLLNEGELYWNSGSGGAALNCAWNGDTASLELIFEKSLGFYLVYRDIEQNQFISLGSGDFDHTVAPVYGGEPLLLPTKFFVPRESAWAAVEEFCSTGHKTSKVTWANSLDVDWDFGIAS